MPHVLPPNPASEYGQGADNARLIQGGGQLLPHSPLGASCILPAPQWFLNLLKDECLPVGLLPQSSSSPTGNQRGSHLAERFDLSEMLSEEDSDDN